ncbi:sensor histidine kinase [Cohnella faecalis]|nr:ATP-binding protein [Cohnella faecalis]
MGMEVMIPPLSIQPLVENAVRHGILKRAQGGEVRIRIVDRGEYAEVTIADNGVGVEESAMRRFRDGQASEEGRGIGLGNTDRRLKQIYGRGLRVDSTPGQGTTVSFSAKK